METGVGPDDVAPLAAGVFERLAGIRRRILDAGGDPSRITIVAVTKGQPLSAVLAARRAGLADIGENYAAELLEKAATVPPEPARGRDTDGLPTLRWHYLGAIQRNKIARLSPVVSCWQAVSRAEEAAAIGRHRPGAEIFVEVAAREDPGRPGVAPDAVAELVEAARRAKCRVRGLMTVAPLAPPAGVAGAPAAGVAGAPADVAAEAFGIVAGLARELGLEELSMGMTDDLEQAVAAGTTMIRIGRALFGDRPSRGPRERPAGLQQ